jgi:hypothetical protein
MVVRSVVPGMFLLALTTALACTAEDPGFNYRGRGSDDDQAESSDDDGATTGGGATSQRRGSGGSGSSGGAPQGTTSGTNGAGAGTSGATTGGASAGATGGTTLGTTSGAGTGGTSGGTAGSTAGTSGATSAGGSGGSANAFTGAPAYAAGTASGQSTAVAAHRTGNPGQNCQGCHAGATAPRFGVAGTIQGAGAGAEVRIVDGNGAQLARAYTDSVGNFWVAGNVNLGAGARVGIRNGTSTRLMAGPITSAACNSCHGASAARLQL